MSYERAARRRAERARRKIVVDRAGGMVYTGLGQHYEVTKPKDLPPKVEGEHRFIVTAAWFTTDEALRSDEPKLLDHETAFTVVCGCYDCEQPWSTTLDPLCPGDPSERAA